MSAADIVHAWFREKLATGPLGRDTPAYNQAFQALPELIARLEAAETPPKPAAPPPPAPEPKPAPESAKPEAAKPAPGPAPEAAEPEAPKPPPEPKSDA